MTQRNPLFDAGKEPITVMLPRPWIQHIRARAKGQGLKPTAYLREIVARWYLTEQAAALAERSKGDRV